MNPCLPQFQSNGLEAEGALDKRRRTCYADLQTLAKSPDKRRRSIMNHVDITMNDSRLIADLGPDGWQVNVFDSRSGESSHFSLNTEEFGCLVALMTGSWSSRYEKDMYEIVNPKISHLPRNLRPIP